MTRIAILVVAASFVGPAPSSFGEERTTSALDDRTAGGTARPTNDTTNDTTNDDAEDDADENATAKKDEAPKTPHQKRLDRAFQLRRAHRYAEAIGVLHGALALDPTPAEAAELKFQIGQVHFAHAKAVLEDKVSDVDAGAQMKKAMDVFAAVVKEYPKEEKAASAAYMIGSSHLLLDDLQQAMAGYRRAYVDFPGFDRRSKALLRYGVCLAGMDYPKEAIQVYQRLLKEFPDASADVKKARKYLSDMSLVGKPAPRLRSSEFLHGVVGEENLKTFDGSVVVVIFFATWCNHCKDNMPRLRRLIKEWSDRGVVFLGVANPNDPDNTEAVDSYVERNRIDFLDVCLDRRFASWRPYGVTGLPACALIDRSGTVRWRGNLSFFPLPLMKKLLAE